MFTGLVQSTGTLEALTKLSGGDARLRVRPFKPFTGVEKGESVAVNGACLTVEDFTPAEFSAYASSETLRRTTLGALKRGGLVNLERALRLGDRLGGHIVSGHVDCVARVAVVSRSASSLRVRLEFPAAFAAEVAPKGSVALDGVSLTINECGADFLEVNVIPATLGETALESWQAGTAVNMETDILAKYVHRALTFGGQGRPSLLASSEEAAASPLTLDFLRENGFY